jgi:hypothetical protein
MKFHLICLGAALAVPSLHAQGDWPAYGFDQSGQRHSPLAQSSAAHKQIKRNFMVMLFKLLGTEVDLTPGGANLH